MNNITVPVAMWESFINADFSGRLIVAREDTVSNMGVCCINVAMNFICD